MSSTATIHFGDCIRGMAMQEHLEPESIDLTVTSIPFASLFMYSGKTEDVGNSPDAGLDFVGSTFGLHMRFFVEQLFRVQRPGTLVCIHVQQLLTYKIQHGFMGRRDFRGAVIDLVSAGGFNWVGEFVIQKNPQLAAQRSKLHSLLFVTGMRDARDLAPTVNDYVLLFKKPGEAAPVPCLYDADGNPEGWVSREEWIRDAHGVWTDIRETDVLGGWKQAREDETEKHVCLARGSLVLTYDGYRPIEEVQVGDLVLTHQGRWRPVVAVACTGMKPVRRLDAQGVPGLLLTDDHRLWARDVSGLSSQRQRTAAERQTPGWLRADEAESCYLNLKLPPIEESPHSEEEWWIVGRWLADGHIGARGEIVISAGYQKLDALIEKLGDRGGSVARHQTAAQVRIRDRGGRLRAIIGRFGRGAGGKVVPGEALSLDIVKAQSLLAGCLSGDGHLVPGRERWMATTISRPLALGLAMIAQRALGAIASVHRGKSAGQAVIEGRTVTTADEWVLSFDVPEPWRHNRPFILADGAWKKVRANRPSGEAEVWDITVDEDHSFTAEGCVVENCPLQLPVIRRLVRLYSNPGELVLDPFMGIGSTAVVALEEGRNAVGFELKESYYRQAVGNVRRALEARQHAAPLDLWSLADTAAEEVSEEAEEVAVGQS